MTSPGQDPRLLRSVEQAKALDVEARFNQHIATHPAAPPSLVYGQTPGSVIQSANGTYTWTCPAGVTQAKIECWGAGAGGGGGGSSQGGFGGGGGAYAAEPAYAVVPGQQYTYLVGNGGTGGTTGNAGIDGGDTSFDNGGIFAAGGAAHSGSGGGQAGGNTIAHSGGAGGQPSSTGGGGGGGSAGASGDGGGGGNTSSATGGAAGPAGAGGGAAGGGGGNNAAGGSAGQPPGGGGGGAGASTSATSGSNSYRLNSSATYAGSDATGGNANQLRNSSQTGNGAMHQGGTTASGGSYNGTQKALGIIGGNPQSDLSGKTIDTVSIRLEQTHCWYNSGAYIILGYTPFTSFGSSWGGGSITAVKTWWQGPATDQGGGSRTTDLTGFGLGNAMQSGAAQSISLGPGTPGYNLYNYTLVYGAGGDNNQNPLIAVTWHTGAAPVQAGAGRDGQVRISYQISGVLQAALQPAAGVDDPVTGNAFAAGYTGTVQQFQYSSSPALVESWHSLTPLPSGLTGTARYKLVAEASCILFDLNVSWASGSAATFTLPGIPAGYQPSGPGGLARIYTIKGNAAETAAGQSCRLYINGATVQVIVPATSAGGTASWTGILPLN
jgi:hypothetical protein